MYIVFCITYCFHVILLYHIVFISVSYATSNFFICTVHFASVTTQISHLGLIKISLYSQVVKLSKCWRSHRDTMSSLPRSCMLPATTFQTYVRSACWSSWNYWTLRGTMWMTWFRCSAWVSVASSELCPSGGTLYAHVPTQEHQRYCKGKFPTYNVIQCSLFILAL